MKHRGFTLLELLIALSVFAVVSLLSYQGLTSVITTKATLDAQRESLRELNLALGIVTRDLSSALLRPTRDGNNRAVAALTGDSLQLEFPRISAGALAQGVERVRYSVSRGVLLRERYVSADPGFGPPSERRELLRNVERINWRYFSPEGAWSERYPAADVAAAQARLPRAVELNLSVTGVGELRRIVLLPNSPEFIAP
jgi:general secretion pathway protein J